MSRLGPVGFFFGTLAVAAAAVLYVSMLYINRFGKGALLGPFATWKTIDAWREDLGIKRQMMPFAALFVQIFLVTFTAVLQNFGRAIVEGGIDNEQPRAGRTEAKGLMARLYGLHSNTSENLTIFACALFAGHVAQVPLEVQSAYAILFIITRLLYTVSYLANASTLRSFFFFAGTSCCYLLLLNAVFGQTFDKEHTRIAREIIDALRSFATPATRSEF